MLKSITSRSLLIIGLCIMLASCGWHLRSQRPLAPQLNIVYLDAKNPYDPVTVQLRRLLQSSHVRLTKSISQAPAVIHISRSKLSYPDPTAIASQYAQNYVYSLTTRVRVTQRSGTAQSVSHTFRVQRKLTKNVNQVYTPEANKFMYRQLVNDSVDLIYDYLSSLSFKKNPKHFPVIPAKGKMQARLAR